MIYLDSNLGLTHLIKICCTMLSHSRGAAQWRHTHKVLLSIVTLRGAAQWRHTHEVLLSVVTLTRCCSMTSQPTRRAAIAKCKCTLAFWHARSILTLLKNLSYLVTVKLIHICMHSFMSTWTRLCSHASAHVVYMNQFISAQLANVYTNDYHSIKHVIQTMD